MPKSGAGPSRDFHWCLSPCSALLCPAVHQQRLQGPLATAEDLDSNDLKSPLGFILACWHVLGNNISLAAWQLHHLNLLCSCGDLLECEKGHSSGTAISNEAWFLILFCPLLDWPWVLPFAFFPSDNWVFCSPLPCPLFLSLFSSNPVEIQ